MELRQLPGDVPHGLYLAALLAAAGLPQGVAGLEVGGVAADVAVLAIFGDLMGSSPFLFV